MIELPTPIFDNLIVPEGAYGSVPKDLIELATSKFIKSPDRTQVFSVLGIPLSGKSRILGELPTIIRRQPMIQDYEQQNGSVAIQNLEWDVNLKRIVAAKGRRDYLEEEYPQALAELVKDVRQTLKLMAGRPGFLLIGYVAITDLELEGKFIGYPRGGVDLHRPLIKKTNGFAGLEYDHYSFVLTSDDEVKKLGKLTRGLINGATPEKIQALAKEMHYQGDPRELGGAIPGIAGAEETALLSAVMRLWQQEKIKIPPNNHSWENIIREYLPFYFKNLNVPEELVTTPFNSKLPI